MIDMKYSSNPLRSSSLLSPLFCILLFLTLATIPAKAEDGPTINPATASLTETISKNLETLESDKSKNDEASEELKDLYRQAIASLENATAHDKVRAGFIQAARKAPQQTQVIRDETAEVSGKSVELAVKNFRQLSLEELESHLLKEKADLASYEANRTKNQEALKYNGDRPQAIRQRLNEANTEAEGIASDLQQPLIAGISVSLNEAKHWVREARAVLLSSEISMLDEELSSHKERTELIKARIEHAQTSISYTGKRLERLVSLIDANRSAKASIVQQETRRSRLDTAGGHQLLQKLAESNTELGLQISQYTTDLKQAEEEAEQTSTQAKKIDLDHKKAQQKLDIAGMSKILGSVLREQRRALPDIRQHRKIVRELEKKIADISLQQLEYKEERQQLMDLDSSIQKQLTLAREQDKAELRDPIGKLLTDRRDYLSQLITIQDSFVRALSELDFAQTHLLETAASYDAFLAENLLWIRSAPRSSLTTLKTIPKQLGELFSVARWKAVILKLWEQAGNSPILLLIVLIVAILLWKKPYLVSALKSSGDTIGKPSKDSILYTLQGLVLTILLALPWPLLMAGAGWQLQSALSIDVFTKSVSQALLQVSEALFILLAFIALCSKDGVASAHFKWPRQALVLLRQDFRLMGMAILPLGFINIIVLGADFPGREVGLGRFTFVMMMLGLTWFLYRILNPSTGALVTLLAHGKKHAITGIRYTWLLLTISIPVIAALMAMAGYLYTASILVENLVYTMWLIMGLVSAHQFVLRWLIVIRGRLMLKAARDKRKAEREAAILEQEGIDPPNSISLQANEERVDINTLSEDSLSLLNLTIIVIGVLGLWIIWSDIIPALGIFNQVALYSHSIEVGGETVLKSITLADIGQTFLILVIMILLIRRLPAFLEILLRQRKSISSGSLYAIKSLTTYALIGIGVMLIFSELGGAWSDFQWIIAALGVGIGFGLQEIVANFISGLIILFERPIRVGDVVTVGEISGTVTRIQIRATTIQDWDRKELLVPNKEFITSRLLNWSLSDSVTRLSTTVGVAYGSDVELAMQLIGEAARENEMILDTPPPDVLFMEFGDNSLNLVARVFINNLDYRVKAVSDLNRSVNEKLNKAGIVIAFPQRDIHLDTSQPLDIRINK